MLPLSRPIFVVVIILQFTTLWNEYLFGLVFGPDEARPITAALAQLAAHSEGGVRAYNLRWRRPCWLPCPPWPST